MSCREFEPLLALYAGGDLDETVPVEAHLAQCPACRELLDDLQASQSVLRDWSPDPVDAAFLAEVRRDVLKQVENRRRPMWPWIAALATAAAIVFVATPADPVPPPPRPAPPLVAEAPVVKASAPSRRPRKRVVRRHTGPLVVKMLTDDPDIVVIWLVDQTGD